MVKVKTTKEELKFRIQGKMVDNISPIRVNVDHNVQCKLNEGILEMVLDEKPKKQTIEEPVEIKKEKPAETEDTKKKKAEK